jgi:hypothetical protein
MNLTPTEEKLFRKLDSPVKIQDFINSLKINFEEDGIDTCVSPRTVLKKGKAHCIEAAFLAAAILWFHGHKPVVIDMRATEEDFDHVIAVFKKDGKFGAISKSNHAVLRYREPIYRDIQELVMSYFHEYSDSKSNKTLREFSIPIDLSIFDKDWITSDSDLWHIHDYLDTVKHFKILTKEQEKNLRKQDKIEQGLDKITEYKKPKKKLPSAKI